MIELTDSKKQDVMEPLLNESFENVDETDVGILKEAWVEPDILSRQQINQCWMDIDDIHPLRDRVQFAHIMPLCARCKKPKPTFNYQLRVAMLAEMKIKMPGTDKRVNKHPFLLLGFGINSYFDIIAALLKMFLLITFFFSPTMCLYSQNHQDSLKHQPFYEFTQFSLGNMGGAHVRCKHNKLQFNTINLRCETGRIQIDDAQYGVASSQIDNQVYCKESALVEHIEERKNATLKKKGAAPFVYKNCTDQLDKTKLKNTMNECKNTTNCNVEWTSENIFKPEFSFEPNGFCGEQASLFIQYRCLIDKDLFTKRKIYGLFIACQSVFVYLFIIIYFDYIATVEKNAYIDFDVRTITAGDYSVEFDLEVQTYDNFKDKYFDENNPMSENSQFKLYLQNEMERRINAMDDLGYREEDEREEPIKIAQITFAYENGEIIEWLQKRGAFIASEKWDKLVKINDQIHTKITTNEDFLNKIQLPCTVFLTFEDEEGKNRALEYNNNPQMTFLGEELDIHETAEPTDIIWENREYSDGQRTFKTIVAWSVITVLLMCAFFAIFKCSVIANTAESMYPIANCVETQKQWEVLMKKKNDQKMWQRAAVIEYSDNLKAYTDGTQTYYTQVYQCFCQQTSPKGGKQFNPNLKFSSSPQKDKYGKVAEAPICKAFSFSLLFGAAFGGSLSIIIVVINLILKGRVISLLTWVKDANTSTQLAKITNGVFASTFIDTGLLLTFANSNLKEHPPHFITNMFHGPFHDYEPNWYSQVGWLIVKTMIINSMLPYIGLTTGFAIPGLKRWLDRGRTKDIYKTKKTSMAMYKKEYSGAQYVIHFKQSNILLVVFVTLMYGVGMPLLYPVAAFNFFNQYVCERCAVSYQVQLPPAIDDSMTKNLIAMMYFAPFFMLSNGYWMISNQQIFNNKTFFVDNSLSTTSMRSGHFIAPFFYEINWVTPQALMLVAALTLLFFTKIFAHKLQDWGFGMMKKDIEVDEDLPNFFKVIKLSQADEIVFEEENMKNNFGIAINDPDTVQLLDDTDQPKKAIQGTPWYTVLSNQVYQNNFAYIGAFVGEREKLLEDGRPTIEDDDGNVSEERIRIMSEQSDLVMLLLNIAVIPDTCVTQIKHFGPGWQKDFQNIMEHYKNEVFPGKVNKNVKWEFQNGYWEENYAEFVKQQILLDEDLVEETEEWEIAIGQKGLKEVLED